ncbi:MAG: glycyl radical protein [Candidatus Aminicenantes bacterium]|nr:glycyl radical protein [Candidatus Aminicenantes bacterium]
MNDRIRQLRRKSLKAVPELSAERGVLLTRFYRSAAAQTLSAPLLRAHAFAYMLKHKKITIMPGELIVGERGPAAKATPTYPEITCHSLADLDVLAKRAKTPFRVTAGTRLAFARKIIPYWSGKTMRDRLFERMSPEWLEAYRAGVFTEFMEQRAPGHTVCGEKIYGQGLLDIKKDIQDSLAALDFMNDPQALAREEELRAMTIAADAMMLYAGRHADKARELLIKEKDSARRKELRQIAEICQRVPARAPRNFHEALQHYWFMHVGVISEANPWDSFNPGRLDQHLLPFYERGLAEGTLDREAARELLQAFWIKFNNHPSPPKVGVTAEESGTYTDFALINTGGLTTDGENGVNDLSFLILDVIEEMRLLQPSSAVQVSKKTPDAFLKRALAIVKTGYGQPSIFNSEAIVAELLRQGKSLADARRGGASGCVETGAFGRESYILTGYFNLVKVLEITLNNGVDPRSRQKIGLETGKPENFTVFDELLDAFNRQLNHFIDIKIRGNNIIDRLYARYLPVPFLSLLIDDCVASGRDYHDGGARYNTSYIQGVGLGTITDCLSAIRHHVYERRSLTMEALRRALKKNFSGHEMTRQLLLNKTPRYGNDDDAADDLMRKVFEMFFNAVDGRPNMRGGRFHINLLPTTVHIYFGRMTGATADGRRAGEPLSEGVSPVQGADRLGPTAVIKSVAKIDHLRTGGTLLNQKFTPQLLADEKGIAQLANLVRAYFRLDGHHVQFNVVDAATLRAAQRQPEKYRDLIVRVAGYSDYFVDIGSELQEEIISRTEHGEF